jgi:hypothetical protein
MPGYAYTVLPNLTYPSISSMCPKGSGHIVQGHIIEGAHHLRDASSTGSNVQGIKSRKRNFQGHIVWGYFVPSRVP